MAKRIAKNTIQVMRSGKRVKVLAGSEYDFNADEIKDLESKGALEPETKKPATKTESKPVAKKAE